MFLINIIIGFGGLKVKLKGGKLNKMYKICV